MNGARIDHLVVAGRDLDEMISSFAASTGVTATYGGAHPGLGTHNAVMSLGGDMYLELLAPDPSQAGSFLEQLGLDSHRLVTFAVATSDIDIAAAALERTGAEPGPVIEMSRTRPDGVVLRWKSTSPAATGFQLLVPFAIDWGTAAHPSDSAPGGCELEALTIHHPAPAQVAAMIDALELNAAATELVEVVQAESGSLSARLTTPNGPVAL